MTSIGVAFWKVEFDITLHGFADLQHATVKGLRGIGSVIKRLVQFRMDIGNVKSFKVIVDIEHPIGIDHVVSVARSIEHKRLKSEESQALLKPFPWYLCCSIECSEVHAHPLFEGKLC